MPHDLFDDLVVRPPVAQARRRALFAISVVAHAALVLLLATISVVAPDALPVPARALAYFEPSRIMPVDIPLPAPPRVIRRGLASAGNDRVSTLPTPSPVPLAPPTGIGTEREHSGAGPLPSAIATIEGGRGGDPLAFGSTDAPPPPPVKPVRLHSGIQAPRKIVDVAPEYPKVAQIARIEGIVILEVVIAANGRVESARVLRSVPLLDQAALDAVRQWAYTPTRLNGVAVPVMMTLTVQFRLN